MADEPSCLSGAVKTDMNREHGQIEVDESASGVISVTQHKLTAETSGSFWDWNGDMVSPPHSRSPRLPPGRPFCALADEPTLLLAHPFL
jgi:hypothetical protein